MKDKHSEAWARHRDEQARWWRENTTPEQRMLWLEEMIWVFRDYLPKKCAEENESQRKNNEQGITND